MCRFWIMKPIVQLMYNACSGKIAVYYKIYSVLIYSSFVLVFNVYDLWFLEIMKENKKSHQYIKSRTSPMFTASVSNIEVYIPPPRTAYTEKKTKKCVVLKGYLFIYLHTTHTSIHTYLRKLVIYFFLSMLSLI